MSNILVSDLTVIEHEQGDIIKYLSADSPALLSFGESYFSWIKSGGFKGWKRHLRMTMNLTVLVGEIIFYFRSGNSEDLSKIQLSSSKPRLLTVSPNIWFAFQAVGGSDALLINTADILHSENEIERAESDLFNHSELSLAREII